MLKIVRSEVGDLVLFTLSGRIEVEHAAELQKAFDAETLRIVLDLQEVKRVDRDVLPCLTRWESSGITLQHCPPYVRQWIDQM